MPSDNIRSLVRDCGIIGYGVLGKATSQMLDAPAVYDPASIFHTEQDLRDACRRRYTFICVPTPPSKDGPLDTSIVEQMARLWVAHRVMGSVLVIRSTVNIGTCDSLTKAIGCDHILFWPEFLTERTAYQDFMEAKEFIVGGRDPNSVILFIQEALRRFFGDHRDYVPCTLAEAEAVKLVRNSFYFLKVMFFNQISAALRNAGVDYPQVMKAAACDWLNEMHTRVPGPDGFIGCGGKCLPKDAAAMEAFLAEWLPSDELVPTRNHLLLTYARLYNNAIRQHQ